MITSVKISTKQTNKQTKNGQTEPRTNGKRKAIQTKSHKETCTYTFIKGEKGKIYIYI